MSAPAAVREDWSLEDLQTEAEDLRGRLNRFRKSLGRFLVEKQELIDLMVVAAVAQEPLLLVGPPGTAKSDLVLKFKDALGLADEDYFEYMLTRFTEPSEIIGPIDISQLREGRYIRREQGKLPTARLGFLDEIFKSNSAILNILLTIINERKFYQDGVAAAGAPARPVRGHQRGAGTVRIGRSQGPILSQGREPVGAGTPLRRADRQRLAVGSPPDAESEAVDGGPLHARRRAQGQPLPDAHLRPPPSAPLTPAPLPPGERGRGEGGDEQNDRQVFFPAEVFDEFQRLVKVLVREHKIFISDRKLVKLYKLFRVRAWLFTGGTVSRDDLRLLAYLGETHREIELLRDKVPQLLGLA